MRKKKQLTFQCLYSNKRGYGILNGEKPLQGRMSPSESEFEVLWSQSLGLMMVIGRWQPRRDEDCSDTCWVREKTRTMNCLDRVEATRYGVELVAALEKQMEAGSAGNFEEWQVLQDQIEAFGDPASWWRATGGAQREAAAEQQSAPQPTGQHLN